MVEVSLRLPLAVIPAQAGMTDGESRRSENHGRTSGTVYPEEKRKSGKRVPSRYPLGSVLLRIVQFQPGPGPIHGY